MLVAVDAGHGEYTRGKRIPLELDSRNISEWHLNKQVADRLCPLLECYEGVKTIRMDDVTGKTDVPLHSRPKKANSAKADCYISLHHNAAGKVCDACGIVVFVYEKTHNNTSIQLMESAYKHLIQETGLRGNRWSGTQRKNLCVLRESNMPAILCEMGFMTHPTESKVIQTPEHADQCARALAKAIAEVFHLHLKKTHTVKPFDYVRVTASILNIRAGAGTEFNKVGKLHKGEIVQVLAVKGLWYQIKSGYISAEYTVKTNAPIQPQKPEKEDNKEEDTMPVYERLKDVPKSYQPTIKKLMEKKALVGYSNPDPNHLDDNVINVSEDFCRIMTVLNGMGKLD